jgi:hypothetical protein
MPAGAARWCAFASRSGRATGEPSGRVSRPLGVDPGRTRRRLQGWHRGVQHRLAAYAELVRPQRREPPHATPEAWPPAIGMSPRRSCDERWRADEAIAPTVAASHSSLGGARARRSRSALSPSRVANVTAAVDETSTRGLAEALCAAQPHSLAADRLGSTPSPSKSSKSTPPR